MVARQWVVSFTPLAALPLGPKGYNFGWTWQQVWTLSTIENSLPLPEMKPQIHWSSSLKAYLMRYHS
jgi:hypothetical protein